jgi:hypothetical protein
MADAFQRSAFLADSPSISRTTLPRPRPPHVRNSARPRTPPESTAPKSQKFLELANFIYVDGFRDFEGYRLSGGTENANSF